jgi:hypothetical protein
MMRLLLCLCFAFASCASTYTGHKFDQPFDRTTAEYHIQEARAEYDAGELDIALDRLARLHQTSSIDPALRKQAGGLLNDTCVAVIAQLLEEGDPDSLDRIYALELPPRLRVEAGIAAARAYLDEGERVQCFKIVRKVERKFPLHHMGLPAGDLLLEAGLSLAADDSTWFLFFSPAKDRALETLDFMVLNYPFHPGCDQALNALAKLYEDANWHERAITNYEDLVAFYPESALAPEAQARIPLLRLYQMDRADNDRAEILRSRDEARTWLERYPNNELSEPMRALFDEAETRLVKNDLVVARFYLRVNEAFGAELHAKRALEEAQYAANEALVKEATLVLEQANALATP